MDTTFDEQEVIAGCKRGDAQARRRLYERYASSMLAVCTRYAGDRETARDLLQEGFIRVFTKIGGLPGQRFAGGAGCGGCSPPRHSNSCGAPTCCGKAWARTNVSTCPTNAPPSAVERLSADELLQCVAELPDGYRTVFNLYAIEGYSHAEIADMLHIREASSRSQFARARQMLQQMVLQRGGNDR